MADVATGYAADEQGAGVAYARIALGGGTRLVRVPFSTKRYPALLSREVGYAALSAVTAVLRKRGIERARFLLDDVSLVQDLEDRRDLPAALALAYVRLRCELNQLKEYAIAYAGAPADLTARARSETAMHVAA